MQTVPHTAFTVTVRALQHKPLISYFPKLTSVDISNIHSELKFLQYKTTDGKQVRNS
jgi:hypothetical protein